MHKRLGEEAVEKFIAVQAQASKDAVAKLNANILMQCAINFSLDLWKNILGLSYERRQLLLLLLLLHYASAS